MNNFIIIICCLSCFLGAQLHLQAQQPKKAIELYENFGYKSSIPLLEEKINEEGMQLGDLERIANSYRLIHDTENAEKWYSELIQLTDQPIHYLHYAQALQSNSRYNLAKQYFLLYDENMGTDDSRGKRLAEAIDRMNEFKQTDIEIKNEGSINSEKTDYSPAFYKDGIVFVSTRNPSEEAKTKDIWLDDNFMNLFYTEENPRRELKKPSGFSNKISTEYHEGPFTANRKGDVIFFTRSNYYNGKKVKTKDNTVRLNIYMAKNRDESWEAIEKLNFCTDDFDEMHPSLSSDGKSLFFSSNRTGGFGGMDLYVSRFESESWSEPVNLGPGINTPGNEGFPFIHDDGTLYFSSDGWGGLGALDIFSSSKVGDIKWSEPVNIGIPFNSPKDDFGFILNILETEGYFSSARDGGKGLDDIYSFKMPPERLKKPKVVRLLATLYVYDEITKERIPNSQVSIIEGTRDESGFKMSESYQFKAIPSKGKKDFMLMLEKNNTDTIAGYTYMTQFTNRNGEIVYEMEPDKEYIFIAKKTGYVLGKLMYTTEGIKEPTDLYFGISLSKPKDKPAAPIASIGTVLELEKIYYDFDKYYIREGASKSLDQVVALMRLYPSMHIELSAHTDSRGTRQYNRQLSKNRARYARKYIVSKGISNHRITSSGWGESQLRNRCGDGVKCTEEEHQYNRRTEIRITQINRPDIKVHYIDNPPEVIDAYIPEYRK